MPVHIPLLVVYTFSGILHSSWCETSSGLFWTGRRGRFEWASLRGKSTHCSYPCFFPLSLSINMERERERETCRQQQQQQQQKHLWLHIASYQSHLCICCWYLSRLPHSLYSSNSKSNGRPLSLFLSLFLSFLHQQVLTVSWYHAMDAVCCWCVTVLYFTPDKIAQAAFSYLLLCSPPLYFIITYVLHCCPLV
jgi:hypothetical protein